MASLDKIAIVTGAGSGIGRASAIALSEIRNYGELFRFELNWNAPDQHPLTVELQDGQEVKVTNVASYRGLRVWETPNVLGAVDQAAVDRQVARNTSNRLVIFHD